MTTVHPGAFCTPEGAGGATRRGTSMVCSIAPGGGRARWRSGTAVTPPPDRTLPSLVSLEPETAPSPDQATAGTEQTILQPAAPSDLDRQRLAEVAAIAAARNVPPMTRLDAYESLTDTQISALEPEQRQAVLTDLRLVGERQERAARTAAVLERLAQVANGGDAAGGRVVLDRLSDKQLEAIARDAIPYGSVLPTDAIKARMLVDPDLMARARAIPDSEIRPNAIAVQNMAPVRWQYATGKIVGEVPAGQRAAMEEALHGYAHRKVPGAAADRMAEPVVNAALRGTQPLDDIARRHTEAIDGVLEASRLGEPVTVYRGLTNSSFIESRTSGSLVGRSWTDPAFVSSTTSEAAAEAYTGAPGAGFAMRLRLPAQFRAVALQDAGGLDDEGEMLLPRGLTFRITADHGLVDGMRWVDAEVRTPGGRVPDAAEPAEPAPAGAAQAPGATGRRRLGRRGRVAAVPVA